MVSSTSSLKKRVEHGLGVPDYGSTSSLGSVASTLGAPTAQVNWISACRRYLDSEVDISKVAPPLSAYAFVTGYIDAISFSAIFVWVGFQTGNFAQLALGFARYLEHNIIGHPDPTTFVGASRVMPAAEQEAICSLMAFVVGVFVFGRIGDWIGPHKRLWLVGGTLVQALLTAASALTFKSLEESSRVAYSPASTYRYFVGVACLSASLGVQGFMARRLSTQFSTTIVLTTVFVELATDPTLFQVTRSVQSRDQKWLAVIFVFLGAVSGRLILGQLGTSSTLGVAVVIRVLIAFSWLFIPARYIHLP